jgi:DNA repair protein RecN (Recombination protein N)
MLLELTVENYAVVDRLRVHFHAGLNLLTGETGSGKSLVVDALGLLLGGRASADMIRSGEERARIAGLFDVRENPQALRVLATAGLEAEDGELLIEREILAGGKSRAYAGSRPASVALLKDLAPHLGDIHGQHDQQLLFSAEAQRDMLDAFAGTEELLAPVKECQLALRKVEAELEVLERSEQEKLRLLDLWQFQKQEIAGARIEPGEDAALEAERRVQQNLGRLQESAGAAYAALYDSPESALVLARLAAKRLEELARIDPAVGQIRESLQPAEIALQETSFALRDYLSRLEADPGRLDEIELRLAALDKLKRKYGPSLEDVVAFAADVASQIAAVEHAGERMEALRVERRKLADQYQKAAEALSARRKAAAAKLEKRVETELKGLAMERTAFRIAVNPAEASESGVDAVAFLVSPNVGEEVRPLASVASGGEISRIALALKTCVTQPSRAGSRRRTLVFDEVDAGIGGSAAEGVGRRLKKLAEADQVLCVTHLAQIACFADHHYIVEKHERNGRTVAGVEELDHAARTREIGRMLSGQVLTSEALKHAERLLKMTAS